MTPILISGNPAEVRKQFEKLSLPEDMVIDVTVKPSSIENALTWTDIEKAFDENWEETFQQMRDENAERRAVSDHAALMRRYDEEFADVPRVDGILQVPISEPTTVERIKELSEN